MGPGLPNFMIMADTIITGEAMIIPTKDPIISTISFFLDHCVYPAGRKDIRILMAQLAQEVGDSRLDVSRVLNAMQAEGLLYLHRGRIEIPSLERLLM